MVVPSLLMRCTKENTSSTSLGIRPSDGSSSISSFGPHIMPRAMATICCSPPESVPASWFERSWMRGKISYICSSRCWTSALSFTR